MPNTTTTSTIPIHTHYNTDIINESYEACVYTHITKQYPTPTVTRDIPYD